MKLKLHTLFIFFLTSFFSFSQTEIEQLQSASGSQYINMSGTIDQTISGANVSWDFTSLTETVDVSVDTYTVNGNNSNITTTTNGSLSSSISLTNTSGEIAIIQGIGLGIQVDYTDAGVIGTFPLSYGYSNTDNVEGTFSGSGVSGTVLSTSTIVVDTDAWGNLKTGTFDGEVTRLKIVQNLNLLLGFIPATGTQTSYFYYDANSNGLVFRTTRVVVPLASLDQTSVELLSTYTLSNPEIVLKKPLLVLETNPVKHILKFKVDNTIKIKGIEVYDISGKVVLNYHKLENDFDVSKLRSGLFIVSINTNKGIIRKKFIKE